MVRFNSSLVSIVLSYPRFSTSLPKWFTCEHTIRIHSYFFVRLFSWNNMWLTNYGNFCFSELFHESRKSIFPCLSTSRLGDFSSNIPLCCPALKYNIPIISSLQRKRIFRRCVIKRIKYIGLSSHERVLPIISLSRLVSFSQSSEDPNMTNCNYWTLFLSLSTLLICREISQKREG